MVTNLRKIGADIEAKAKFIIINGGRPLAGARVSSFGDHRTAMSMLVAGLGAKGKVIVTGLGCINKSFPNFLDLLNKLN
jgi:3-phosphoshikimate 1-carboxyvinyltransferase